FLPKNDESQFGVSVRAPEGTTVEQTELIASRIGREIKKIAGVNYTVVMVAEDERRTANLANIFVKLIDVDDRTASQFEIMNAIRRDVMPRFAHEKLRVSVSPVGAISGGGLQNKEVAYYLSGPDLKKLADYSQRLTETLAKTP